MNFLFSFVFSFCLFLKSFSQNSVPRSAMSKFMEYSNGDNKIFIKTEVPAEYKDGEKKLQKYLLKGFDATLLKNNNLRPGVYSASVWLLINKKGDIISAEPETDLGAGIEAGIIKLLREGKKWNAATQNGYPVMAIRKVTMNLQVE